MLQIYVNSALFFLPDLVSQYETEQVVRNTLKASLSWVCCTMRKKLEAIIINLYEHK